MKQRLPQHSAPRNGHQQATDSEQEGGPLPPDAPAKRGRRLRTLTHVKAGLGAVIRQLETGKLEPKRGNALVYAYSTLAGVMANDVVAEIAELRESVLGLGDRHGGRDA